MPDRGAGGECVSGGAVTATNERPVVPTAPPRCFRVYAYCLLRTTVTVPRAVAATRCAVDRGHPWTVAAGGAYWTREAIGSGSRPPDR
jgi:hypothetical protein